MSDFLREPQDYSSDAERFLDGALVDGFADGPTHYGDDRHVPEAGDLGDEWLGTGTSPYPSVRALGKAAWSDYDPGAQEEGGHA